VALRTALDGERVARTCQGRRGPRSSGPTTEILPTRLYGIRNRCALGRRQMHSVRQADPAPDVEPIRATVRERHRQRQRSERGTSSVDLNGSRASLNVESQRLPPGYWCCCRPNQSQARYTSSASITRPEATARSTAILCHVTISSFTVTFTHTAISAHPTSETMNVATLMRINNLFTVYPPRKATAYLFGTLSADPDPEGSTRHVRFRAVPEETLEDVRRRILASLEEVESTRPARRWRGVSSERIRRNHRLALGVVDLLDGIARELGSGRVRAFADEDTPGGTPLVLQARNPDAAGLKVLVDWFDDNVHLYPAIEAGSRYSEGAGSCPSRSSRASRRT
jgi:hypothetical protein